MLRSEAVASVKTAAMLSAVMELFGDDPYLPRFHRITTSSVPVIYLAHYWAPSAADALYYRKSDEVRGITGSNLIATEPALK